MEKFKTIRVTYSARQHTRNDRNIRLFAVTAHLGHTADGHFFYLVVLGPNFDVRTSAELAIWNRTARPPLLTDLLCLSNSDDDDAKTVSWRKIWGEVFERGVAGWEQKFKTRLLISNHIFGLFLDHFWSFFFKDQ